MDLFRRHRRSLHRGHDSSKDYETQPTNLTQDQIEEQLEKLCRLSCADKTGRRPKIPPVYFEHITFFVRCLDHIQSRRDWRRSWHSRPRIYTILRAIGALHLMDEFISHHTYDLSLPFDHNTVPRFLTQEDVRIRFLEAQDCVLTDARTVETSEDHISFAESAEQHFLAHTKLGSGGFGYVDCVWSKLSLELYARKRYRRRKDDEVGELLQRYITDEIMLMRKLKHRHLTQIMGSYTDPDYIAYLMKPVAQCNLWDFLTRQQNLDLTATVILRQSYGCLAGAVDYLHQQKVRHRDLKPQNILIYDTQVYIADFGTAFQWSDSTRGTTRDRGAPATPWYMAPELDVRDSRNAATDMWSLGIVFLEMLTVLKRFNLDRWRACILKKAHLDKKRPYPCSNVNAIPDWLKVLRDSGGDKIDNEPLIWIAQLLHSKPERRVSAQSLVQSVSESSYFPDFACLDCAQELKDPDFNYSPGRADRRSIEVPDQTQHQASADTLTAMTSHPQPEQSTLRPEVIQSINTWIDATWYDEEQEHCLSFLTAKSDFADSDEFGAGRTQPLSQRPAITVLASELESSRREFNEHGFFVYHDDGSSDEVAKTVADDHDDQPFNIYEDSSSEGSDQISAEEIIDSPMLNDEAPAGLGAIIEEQSEEEESSTVTLSHLKDKDGGDASKHHQALELSGHVEYGAIGPEIHSDAINVADVPISHTPADAEPSLESEANVQRPRGDRDKDSKDPAPIVASLGVVPTERPSDKSKVQIQSPNNSDGHREITAEDLPGMPFPGTVPGREQSPRGRGETGTRTQPKRTAMANDLPAPPTYEDAIKSSKATTPVAEPILDSDTNRRPEYRKHRSSASPKDSQPHAHLAVSINIDPARDSTGKRPKARRGKLSASNVEKLNAQTEIDDARTKSPRRVTDEDFNPAKYVEEAWKKMEATESMATSLVSEGTRRKLSGRHILVGDRSYDYLEHYCKDGKADAVRLLLKAGCNPGTLQKPRPKPLLLAIKGASARHNKCVKILISKGCDVNAVFRKRTPIHWAIERPHFNGYLKLLGYLLGGGAEMDTPDGEGEYPIHKLFFASASGKAQTQQQDSPLQTWQIDALALILHPKVLANVDVNVRQPVSWNTPLHLAVKRRTPAAVAMLLHSGADANAKNASGTTPLLIAASQWRGQMSLEQEMVLYYLLQSREIIVDAQGGSLYRSALQYACAAGCALAVEMLLEKGAGVQIRDKKGLGAMAVLEAAKENLEKDVVEEIENMLTSKAEGRGDDRGSKKENAPAL